MARSWAPRETSVPLAARFPFVLERLINTTARLPEASPRTVRLWLRHGTSVPLRLARDGSYILYLADVVVETSLGVSLPRLLGWSLDRCATVTFGQAAYGYVCARGTVVVHIWRRPVRIIYK